LAAFVATVFLFFARPVKLLARIQIVLSVLFIVAVVVVFKTASWLHSMAYDDPVREHWQSKLEVPMNVLWFGTLLPWLLFTVFHVIVVMRRKVRAKSIPTNPS
jgi:hypothetical protein